MAIKPPNPKLAAVPALPPEPSALESAVTTRDERERARNGARQRLADVAKDRQDADKEVAAKADELQKARAAFDANPSQATEDELWKADKAHGYAEFMLDQHADRYAARAKDLADQQAHLEKAERDVEKARVVTKLGVKDADGRTLLQARMFNNAYRWATIAKDAQDLVSDTRRALEEYAAEVAPYPDLAVPDGTQFGAALASLLAEPGPLHGAKHCNHGAEFAWLGHLPTTRQPDPDGSERSIEILKFIFNSWKEAARLEKLGVPASDPRRDGTELRRIVEIMTPSTNARETAPKWEALDRSLWNAMQAEGIANAEKVRAEIAKKHLSALNRNGRVIGKPPSHPETVGELHQPDSIPADHSGDVLNFDSPPVGSPALTPREASDKIAAQIAQEGELGAGNAVIGEIDVPRVS